MPKPGASKEWLRALAIVSVLVVLAAALLVVLPATHRGSPRTSATETIKAAPAARSRVQADYAALPLAFEPNQGQTDARVEYLARGSGYTLFLAEDSVVFSLHPQTVTGKNLAAAHRTQKGTAVVRLQLSGASGQPKISASEPLPGKSNYFLGSDPGKWRTDVAHYARVSYQDIYPGVNMAFHGAQRQVEFDFVVAPKANPALIGFSFAGAQGLKTDSAGNLIITSGAGNVLLHKPLAYQEQNGARQPVDAKFVLDANNQVRFQLGNYDRGRELVIDPTVSYAYSTYLGGTANDVGEAIAIDGNGNSYVTGQTASTDFPKVTGGYSGSNSGGLDVFVTKINSDGSALIYSTYVGGTGDDSGNAIAVDAAGDAFVAGGTSATFPTTTGAFQTAAGGSAGNAFVFELSPDGSKLSYSTYLGGNGHDVALGLALDGSGNIYVGGTTSSTDFPSKNALQASINGTTNGFVSALNSTGSALIYSTYLGAGAGDVVNAVAVDSTGNAYVTGTTGYVGFPSTGGVQTTFGGGSFDAFVTAISPTGPLLHSTYVGGSGVDHGRGIAVDSTGIYVTGSTASAAFPGTFGSGVQAAYGGAVDAFVTKLKTDLSGILYSTYLGGLQADIGASIAVDGAGNAYVTGQTFSSPFPLAGPTSGAPQSTIGGSPDAFVSEINAAGSALVFSTYLGGSLAENNTGDQGAVAVDSQGTFIYLTGSTTSTTGFPLSASPLQSANGGGTDAFAVKYAQGPAFTITASTPTAVAPGSSGTSTVTLKAFNAYSSPVNLTCTVTGSGSPLPACSATSFSTNPVTPSGTSTLTITTTGPHAANVLPSRFFYAMWLPVAGLSLVGMSFSSTRSRRKKLLGLLMIGMVMAALSLMPACGGGSSSGGGGGGGGGGGTPAGAYTVTITGTGTDAVPVVQNAQITLTVN